MSHQQTASSAQSSAIGKLLPILREACQRHHVRTLDLFGSYARGEETMTSDLDLVVSFEKCPPTEYSNRYFKLLHSLEDQIDTPIDLLTADSISLPHLKRAVKRDSIRIYES